MAELITIEDTLSIFNDDLTPQKTHETYNKDNKIIPKIISARKDPRVLKSYKIDPSNFDKIYVTSDIHSDYCNFVEFLNKLKLIKIKDDLDIYKEPYNVDLLLYTEWIAENTLFVILGDIVDGKRDNTKNIKNDLHGIFEVYLHIFIYNLRIRAWSKNSDIIFTIGNHELHNSIESDYIKKSSSGQLVNSKGRPDNWGFLSVYITDEAKKFFGTLENRKSFLGFFYLLSPYLFIELNNSKTHILMIHSSIFASNDFINSKLKLLRKEQAKIDNNIEKKDKLFLHGEENFKTIVDILSGRAITEDKDLCENHRSDILIPRIIVVGHCPTSFATENKLIENTIKNKTGPSQEYENCDNPKTHGCVIPLCFEHSIDTRIIMVDTGLSSAFRDSQTIKEKDRFVEILKIEHTKEEIRESNNTYSIPPKIFPRDSKFVKNFNLLYRVRSNNKQILIKPKDDLVRDTWKLKYLKYKKKYLKLLGKI